MHDNFLVEYASIVIVLLSMYFDLCMGRLPFGIWYNSVTCFFFEDTFVRMTSHL